MTVEERLAALEAKAVDCDAARRDGAAAALEAVATELDKLGFFDQIDHHKLAGILRRRATRIRTGEEKPPGG